MNPYPDETRLGIIGAVDLLHMIAWGLAMWCPVTRSLAERWGDRVGF